MIAGYLTGQARDRPQIGDYAWRARTYPHAVRAIQRYEEKYGEPVPTCVCGGRMLYGNGHDFTTARCDDCGRTPTEALDVARGRVAPDGPQPAAAPDLGELIGVLAALMTKGNETR